MRPVGLVLLALVVGAGTAQAAAPPTVRTFKDYRIEIDPVPAAAENADSPRPHQELRILRDGTVLARVANERVDLYGGDLTDLDRKDKRNVVPVLGADVTGTGVPVAVAETYDGGAHCCTTLQTLRARPRVPAARRDPWRQLPGPLPPDQGHAGAGRGDL